MSPDPSLPVDRGARGTCGTAEISSPSYVSGLVKTGLIRPKKRLGQTFLVDRNILDHIVAAAGDLVGRPVIEIGAGLGALTLALARAGADPVVAIEKDPVLLAHLARNTADEAAVRVIGGDALELDLRDLASEEAIAMGNLPYSVTTPLLIRLLKSPVFWPRAVVMVQLEVAERILAAPGGRDYGALTLAVSQVARAKLALRVGRRSFYPAPEVDSAVLILERRETPAGGLDPAGLARLTAVVRAAFGQRRKTAANAIAAGLGLDRALVSAKLTAAGIDPGRRGETLDLDEFVAIERVLRDAVWRADCPPLR
jgi:16S rRNA (adenine1518-N6/adenine1519-N6)-dimethyltransferase